jgi:hypothetical protein
MSDLNQQNIVPAYTSIVKPYTLQEKDPRNFEVFKKSFAVRGELTHEEKVSLNFEFPDYDVFTYYAQTPRTERNFFPVIGMSVRKVIGVAYDTVLIVNLKGFILKHEEVDKVGTVGKLTYKNNIEWGKRSAYRMRSFKLLLIKYLNSTSYVEMNAIDIDFEGSKLIIKPPKTVDQVYFQQQVHEALKFITVQDFVDVYNRFTA